MMMNHIKARQLQYLGGPRRFPVPDEKVKWSVPWDEYLPVDYTAPSVLKGPAWADPDIKTVKSVKPLKFNEVDGLIDRTSYTGTYQVLDGIPRNPIGRTGLIGRGLLGKWGPNHAVDPVVTRWKKDVSGCNKVFKNEKPVIEFVAIKRRDNGEWALPGGMINLGETISGTLKREFFEEALNSIGREDEKSQLLLSLNEFFKQKSHVKLYSGYVDDPRNTDNAWTETVVVNFHDETGDLLDQIQLQAGDDACAVRWMEARKDAELCLGHLVFIELLTKTRGAFW